MVILEIMEKSYWINFTIKLFHLKVMAVLMELFDLLTCFEGNELENSEQKLKLYALQEK